MRLQQLWRDHSLSITCWIGGGAVTALAFAFDRDSRWWDVILGLGQGLLTVALFYTLAGPLVERNKPEERPRL